ncbi:MAG: OmpA family protein [Phycisphaerales bacterium]|nr:MAG: OmpA family protein [Phycisphaerales bacterium]
MNGKRQSGWSGVPKVPAYIVTFSDMVTLLLTFFVMLLSLSSVQDPELLSKGRDSFLESIKNLGIGVLVGKRPAPDFGAVKIKHSVKEPDLSVETRSIDAREETLRRMFRRLMRSMTETPLQIAGKTTGFSATDIHFSKGDATLNEAAKNSLAEFCRNLRQAPRADTLRLLVLGVSNDVTGERERWLLSARRAQAVADFIRQQLSARAKLSVYSWGAGAGGDWVGRGSSISDQAQISIAVVGTGD